MKANVRLIHTLRIFTGVALIAVVATGAATKALFGDIPNLEVFQGVAALVAVAAAKFSHLV